ncbi:MAG: TonB-dependent receptor, partial [Flavobacterium sp.]|uniref:SusC/RagA family TonB-linked outer membrane protein n=1 Tax=Flavobacterium sp. TaxID=239 RepID=UPI0026222A37
MNEKHVIQRFVKAKKLFRKYVFLVLLCSVGVASAQDSDVKITGVVLENSNGLPIPGVNILLKGAKNVVSSDIDGAFSIKAKIGETLVLSYVGYLDQSVKITNNKLTIRLKENVKTLDEVVVIGYGKAKRKDLTGSISSISGAELRKSSPTTIDQALQGKVAGVVVQQTSGQPGGGVSVQIRGLSSFGNNAPLYIIDGVIIGSVSGSYGDAGTNPLATISPSDIESIDVLKDASASAIYGSQATNGVIVITTKRGKEGAPKINYEFSTGFQQIAKMYPTMNLREYATFLNERDAGFGWGFDERPELANPKYLGEGTNWQKELFRNAPMSNHVLSMSGGNDKTQYLMSASYFNQDGIAIGSKFTRTSLRINLDNKTTNWLKIGTSLQLTHIDESVTTTDSEIIKQALSQTPDIPLKNADGTYAGGESTNGWVPNMPNPVALALINKNNPKRNQLYGNLYAEVQLSKDLTLRNEITGSFSFNTQDKFNPTYVFGNTQLPTNYAYYSSDQNANTALRNFLTYNKVFASKYSVNVLLGHEAQVNKAESVWASRENFVSNNITNISSGDENKAKNGGSKSDNAQESYFGRINFVYDDRYLFTVNARADGSSKFAPVNRWVNTYSGSFAWKLNNEKFLKDSKTINELKLRLGYGLTNNQNIRDNAYVTMLETMPNGLSGIAQLISSMGNSGIQWEKTKYSNAGLDLRMFNWRYGLTLDVYDRSTDGLLMQIPLPAYSGTSPGYSPGAISAPYVNIGKVRNRGYDLTFSAAIVRNKDFSWNADFTMSHNENKVLKLNTDGASLIGTYGNSAEVVTQTVVGGSIGDFYGYVSDGIFATAEDFKTHALPTNSKGEVLEVKQGFGGVWYGDRKFKDLDGDGEITPRDRKYLGSSIPKVQFGFNNKFNYGNFDMNIFFSATFGNKVLNALRITGEDPNTGSGYLKALEDHAVLALIDPNGSAADVNNVYVTNPNTTIVGVRNDNSNVNNRFSDIYLED